MKMYITKLGVVAFSVLAMTLTGIPVVAIGEANSHAKAEVTTQTTEQSTGLDSRGTTKLADAKLKACQNRQKTINNIMARISDRGQKQLDLFTTIAVRVETFYIDKGKTLSNYDELVADVTTKKEAAQTAVDAVKANSITFKCDGTDPKGVVTTFKDSLKSGIDALKAYRTSVKNLIVGVKSVQGTTSSSENSQGGQQ